MLVGTSSLSGDDLAYLDSSTWGLGIGFIRNGGNSGYVFDSPRAQ